MGTFYLFIFQKRKILTGPTQFRTIAACLAILAREDGSLTSHSIMPTSDFSSVFPENVKEECYKRSLELYNNCSLIYTLLFLNLHYLVMNY